ncbi:tyrosine-type recombinase/integrase [uncultured Pseudodesulfovibrio sp.]|uniref:tyrosine-type recombinase/integrase n=1 Tax=uncultured Pseudodesulfovibrio sp. TaxID=2035858 RepID=UPI00374826F6
MKILCERAEVKHFSFHAIRHLAASILYHEGTPANVVQTILRHKNATTTERYLHSLGTKEARKALNSVMDNRKPTKVIDIRTQKAG